MEDNNNISGKFAHLRDVFLDAEKEYLEKLKSNPEIKELIENLNKNNARDLYDLASSNIYIIETGLVPAENLEKAEFEIVVLLAAIQDKVREKGERIRNPQKSKEEDFER